MWTGGGYEDGTSRTRVEYDLQPGERVVIERDVEGASYSRGRTMVRCMPWYAAGQYRAPGG